MALPPPPAAPSAPSAPAPTTPSVDNGASEKAKTVIKQFGPAKDDAGNVIPAPKPLGVDLVEIGKDIWAGISEKLTGAGVSVADFIAACELDKTKVPGSKEGRIAYAVANIVAKIADLNDLANKKRGSGGASALKAKLEASQQQNAQLQAQLAAVLAKLEQLGK